jgi:hypothetical protein
MPPITGDAPRGREPSPPERFDDLVGCFAGIPDVTLPGVGAGFGSSALRVSGRIFAMLVREQLVVKLPTARVDHFVKSGDGTNFDANKGIPMRQWLALNTGSDRSWIELATEALTFVRGS